MTTEIQEKAQWLSDIYASVAKGETLQVWRIDEHQWADASLSGGPNMGSMERRWRIKPQPRQMWKKINEAGDAENTTTDPIRVMLWRQAGHTVIEWMEVLP